jgi:DNA (cytosine-5)-methyltransferase 1
MKIGSLCTGYGGLDLAAESYFNGETVWCAELDKYASQVIQQRFNIPNYGNIKEINWALVEPIDILTAGYPCQPFSHAGYRKGTDDERHIFPYILEAISVLRPRYAIMENVRGHLSLGFKEVLKGLASIGYDAKWQLVRASQVGAPHQRARLFIVAYPASIRCQDQLQNSQSSEFINDLIGNTNNEHKPHNRQMQKLGRRFTSRREMHLQSAPSTLDELGRLNPPFVEYMMGLPVGWVTDCNLSRSQQLKMLGNGVVPQQAEYALELLLS